MMRGNFFPVLPYYSFRKQINAATGMCDGFAMSRLIGRCRNYNCTCLGDLECMEKAKCAETGGSRNGHELLKAGPKPRSRLSTRRSNAWRRIRRNCYWSWNGRTSHCTIISVNGIYENMSSSERSVAAPDQKMDDDVEILSLA